MTEENIYDDCNWKNKQLTTSVQISGAWYNLAYMDFEHRQIKHINEGMRDYLMTPIKELNAFKEQSAFEKWGEGLEWGEENKQGDLILP